MRRILRQFTAADKAPGTPQLRSIAELMNMRRMTNLY
jgi:hypothetical protein